jgi:hypothetical protein
MLLRVLEPRRDRFVKEPFVQAVLYLESQWTSTLRFPIIDSERMRRRLALMTWTKFQTGSNP